jgi:uncharacterized protein (DUF1501 family)
MNITRRNLLAGASAGALATVCPGLNVAFAAQTSEILVIIFQRGACDWLQMLAPSNDANYIAARPNIRVRAAANLDVGTLGNTDFFVHPSAPELKALYDAGDLAFVHATGVRTSERSHFQCQDMMEKGYADTEPKPSTGWIARHIASQSAGLTKPALNTIASSPNSPVALLGEAGTISIVDVTTFNISGGTTNANVIRTMNNGSTTYQRLATASLNAVTSVQNGLKTITDTSGTAGYTGGPLSNSLKSLAKLIKMNLGVSVATVDFGSWDMHNSLVSEFAPRTAELSKSIAAFWKDLSAYRSRLTVVTMTEFGRRVKENASGGTDHGSGGGMAILSGNANGGRLYGTWPGLAAAQLTAGDLTVTTDYRQVLSEILVKRHGETNLGAVFPGLAYRPLGIINA